MLMRKYEMPWRTAYEAYAGLAWLSSMSFFAYVSFRSTIPWRITGFLALACMSMAMLRIGQALRVLKVRASLAGRAMEVITTRRLARLTKGDNRVFLGFGFEWHPVHSQRLYELAKVDFREHVVSPWLLRILGYKINPQPDAEIGLPYIHGVEPKEEPIYRPLQNFEGGTLIVGTTQSGKGVVLANLITQAIRRGDVVIILDPKNSKRLKRAVVRACIDYRDADTFLEFHPAFPETGVRLDFLYNWQKPSEIASRIQSILPPDTAGAFGAFAWDAVNVVVQGMVALEDRPNLVKLTKYIEGGIEPLLEASLRRFVQTTYGPGWRDLPEIRRFLQDAQRGNVRRPSEASSADLLALVGFYEHYVAQTQRQKVIDSQIRVYRHNREHYQKITANLLPILSMLTSGDLGRSLSPDPFDEDTRPIMNFEKVERGGHVLYIHLDSLPDPSVASAIGALGLADFAARAGVRYNLGAHRRMSLFVDEVSNVINAPLIEIMNKGAEGGIFTTVAMQTLADLAKRMGSEDAARMALGNLNNLIALRSKDRHTQDFIVETFGRTAIHSLRVGLNNAADAHVIDFTSTNSVQVSESLEELVPAHIMGKLPNLQYFGSIGARLVKGRFQILNPD